MKVRLTGLAAVLLLLVGCTSSGSRPAATIDVSMDEVNSQSAISRDVTVPAGGTLKLSLGANHSTPYRWTPDPKIGDGAVLKQTSHEYVSGDTDRVGAPGTEVWMFTATKAGRTTITASYGPVVGNAPLACTFTANVMVK